MTRETGATTPAARVFLVDSHDIFRHGVRATLSEREGIEVVGAAATLEASAPLLAECRPDVVVVGLRLHEEHLVEQLPRLRRLAPRARVLALSRRSQERSTALLRAGASATLDKDVSSDRLAATVTALAEGRLPTTPAVAAGLAARGDAQASRISAAQPVHDLALARLTGQERRILALIGEGQSNREIAEGLYLAEKTVRNHVTRLLAKLGVSRRTQAALIAVRSGTGAPD